jgi:hypothetical protein
MSPGSDAPGRLSEPDSEEVKTMGGYMIENDVARWEMKRLEREAARLYRAKLLRDEEARGLLAGLAAVGSHVLLNLGNALIAASKRLSMKETSSTAASA